MLTIKDGKVVTVTEANSIFGTISKNRYDIGALSTETLPAGCPIMTTLFVVDKLGVAVCDGNNNWYRKADTPVAAGQPISALF
ncbi:MAG: hypothetical protein IKZ08_02535 [Bacteroidales bacterium]|nr:hypothetical protein [Bacteroidales bacterium]